MKIEIHLSEERGKAEFGWLHSRHSFSFGEYYSPERMGFGALRVLNDDIVEPGMGFDMHPHNNMEIVSIVLKGTLEHKDSEGNHGLIPAGDVQKMSAGTGIRHSEFNSSKKDPVHLLQIWILPKEKNVKFSYGQKSFPAGGRKNRLLPVVSGVKNKDTLFIHQDAAFLLGSLEKGKAVSHQLSGSDRGVYLFVTDGKITVGGKTLAEGDAAAISETDSVEIKAQEAVELLLIEVPLK